MGALTRLDDAELQTIAVEVLGQALSGIDVDSIAARGGRDHDGDAAVFVVVNMPPGSAIIPPRPLADARVSLWKAVEAHGDGRLVYLSVDWPYDDVPSSSDVPT